jgi:hypothetical protein
VDTIRIKTIRGKRNSQVSEWPHSSSRHYIKIGRMSSIPKANTGSNPVLIAMSERYSESLNQDLNNDSAECLRRERDIVGTKESNTPPPSSVDFFNGDAQQVF